MPQYTHDCAQCTFLGRDMNQGEAVDMYFCEQNGLPTIIMRHGNEGFEYTSSLISVINANLETFYLSPMVCNVLIAEDNKLWSRS